MFALLRQLAARTESSISLTRHVEKLLEGGVFLAGLGRRFFEVHGVLVVVDEDVEVVAKNGGGLEQRVLRGDAAVGPDVEDELVVVGHLADPGGFHGILDAGDRREDRVDGDDADRLILALVLVAGGETTADANFEFAVELHLLVEGADDLVLVDHVVDVVARDVTGGDDAFLLDLDREDAGLLFVVVELHLLEVEDDVGDILDHAGKAGKLVLHARDADGSDGRAFQGGKENAAEGVADGVAVSALEWLGDELGVGIGGGFLVADEAVRELETSKFDC